MAKRVIRSVEDLPWFTSLSEHEQEELRKFDRYLHVVAAPVQPVEGAYANVYGEVVFWDKNAHGETEDDG